jgi:peroxiredoxin
MTTMLTSGDQFPDISLTSVTGDTLSLPADLETPYTIVLFYRGHW